MIKRTLLILLLLANFVYGIEVSQNDSKIPAVMINLTQSADSGVIYLSFPDTTEAYDTTLCLPSLSYSTDSTVLVGIPNPESLGIHNLWGRAYYSTGDTAFFGDQWNHTVDIGLMFARQDSIRLSIGWGGATPTWDTATVDLHSKIGNYAVTGGDDLRSVVADIDTSVGKDGVSTSPTSLQMKLGTYSGAAGDNNNVKDDIAALSIGSGGGSEAETLIVLSTGDSTLIQSARVMVRTIDQSTIKVDGLLTDVNGKLILELDPDSFFVAVTHNNYTQIQDTIVVPSGGDTDSLFMTIFDPGSPSSADLCRVYGYLYDGEGGTYKNAVVQAQIPDNFWPIYHDNKAINANVSTKSDSVGYWQLDLWVNSTLSDTTSRWYVTGSVRGTELFYEKINVPDSTSKTFESLIGQ